MMYVRRGAWLLGVSSISLLLLRSAHADPPAVTFSDTSANKTTAGNVTYGFQFTTQTALNVVALGVFDPNQVGLNESHEVGLWDSSGNLLASATVASGTTDPLLNQFRYASITPTLLALGQTYTVGAFYDDGADGLVDNVSNFATNPAISGVSGVFSGGGSLTDPTIDNSFHNPALFAANFEIQGTPEPGGLTLLVGFGLSGSAFAWHRRSRRSR